MQEEFELLLLFSLLVVLNVNCVQPLVRETANGPVEGIEQTSALGQKYYAFRGIPYAEAPITGKDPSSGEMVDRRFKVPKPLDRNWNEILKVYDFADFCVPSFYKTPFLPTTTLTRTSENCLFVNIYIPAGGAEKKTVLVWIYGGGFVEGDPTNLVYGPDFLLSEDNIIVAIQYRVGIFGFLNLGSDEYSGNMGLKDQQCALKWIYENIENFCGNKDEILIFGESAGGASVNFQMLNEESRKYFNRAYAISSSAYSHYALVKANHLQQMQDFVRIYDTEELIEYLKTADSEFLSKQYPFNISETLTCAFVPTIERPSAIEPFITESPDEIYKSNKNLDIDALFSFNTMEILLFRKEYIGKTDSLITENLIDSEIDLPFEGFDKTIYPNEYKQSLELLRTAYYTDNTNLNAIERGNIDLMSDNMIADSVLKAVVFQAKANENSQKNAFLFRFSMDFEINYVKHLLKLKFDGATHGDDLCYMFDCHMFDGEKLYDKHLEEKDATYDGIMRMVKIITNFARTGNPSLEDDTPFETCNSSDEIYCQEITNDPKSSVTTNIKEQLRYDTWREIEEIYKNLRIYDQ